MNKFLLKTEKIKEATPLKLWQLIPALHILDKVDSTNNYLLNYSKEDAKSGLTCLAEEQTMGRGQWGRTWVSPYASHLYLSMLWQFSADKNKALQGLSLVIGVAIVRVLKQLGVTQKIGLKWPNDVYWQHKKLAGVLVDLVPQSIHDEKEIAYVNAVIGIGLNVQMPLGMDTQIDQPWTDLHEIFGMALDRNRIAGLMIAELLRTLPLFVEQGLTPFLKDWQSLDIYYQQHVILHTATGQYSGIAKGITAWGEFVIQCADGIERNFHSVEMLRQS